jgi:hypothetical protein
MLAKKKNEHKELVTVGKEQLFIQNVHTFEPSLRPPFTLITGTPIIMRISKERLGNEGEILYSRSIWIMD